MSTEKPEVPLDTFISVTDLVQAEHIHSRREVYWAIDLGMPHSKIGRRIRVRRADWRAWHERHMRGQVVA